MTKRKIAIICGGPSGERGISLNSARSLYDNLDLNKYELSIIYFNTKLDAFSISEKQIYSNTPLDFDFKLKNSEHQLNREQLKQKLRQVDIVFPAIHGEFGEDGKLQKMLEEFGIKYLGSDSRACQKTSDKHLCQEELKRHDFFTVKDWVVREGDSLPELPEGRYVAKPLHGGSSLGIQYVEKPSELEQKLKAVFTIEPRAIIEPHFEGTEFTIIVLDNKKGEPVALLPTEIEFSNDKFFDYRKKYLASAETRYHTPARFDNKTTEQIRSEAERAFKALGMKDFARLDGWLTKEGTIWFSDINAISGMEQNSFLFQAAALFGLSHKQLLDYIINKEITPPTKEQINREPIPIIFGGDTAERQISVMSGTNVWMKLKSSEKYRPIPLFLTFEKKIYHIPQFLCLHHTVEEIEEKISLFKQPEFIQNLRSEQHKIFTQLGIQTVDLEEDLFIPEEWTLEKITEKFNFLFLGLHGGAGEDGTLQAKLEELKIPYNGPGPQSSKLCMDKYATGQKIDNAQIEETRSAKKILADLKQPAEKIWEQIQEKKFSKDIILKPRGDGCSAGVIRVSNFDQFKKAVEYFHSNRICIPEKAIHDQHGQIDLPSGKLNELLIEDFIKTDKVILKDMEIDWQSVSDLIEVTTGVLGPKNNIHVFNPSQTIASKEILSLEEKFMGGTGINLTPPPQHFVKPEVIEKARKHLKQIAETLEIEGYARIDTFLNIKNGELIVIEANTLPGLTPSTVFYHQALAENPAMNPREVLEKIIEIGKKRYQK